MASGSSGRNNPNSKGFDFASSDDILCSYEDYDNNNQDTSNGTHFDPPPLSSNSTKEFHKSRMVRSSMFPAPACSPQEESFSQDVIITVEKTMKKHTDNLMRFLEGISSRLSQLELYCYNLDKSIGEMRSELVRDHGEADSKLKSVEKHLQEVHRSVQILRDKQELADTQKELAKMQLAQKESSSASEDKASVPSSDQKSAADNTSDGHGQELALVLPNQVTSQGSLSTRPVVQQQTVAPAPPQAATQSQAYYVPPAAQMQNQQAPPQQPQSAQSPYLPADAQYRTPQMQEISRDSSQTSQSQVNQATHLHPSPQYQQHWPQQPQIRPPSSRPYPPYLPSQPPNPSQQDTQPNSLSMQVPYSGISQQGPSRAEPMPYGYGGGLSQPVQQPQPPQHLKINFGVQPNAGYSGPANPYVLYEGEGGQRNHPPQQHFPQGGYAPTSVVPQSPQQNAGNHMVRPPQFGRGHPYGELIEKMVSMGYRGDHVASVIQRLEETGQPIDFNSVLDKLNGLSSGGGGQRGWSG